MRFNYSQLCEAIAATGYVVVASDHPGDTLTDWLTGKNVDDETNDKQRLGDVSFVADCALGQRGELLPGLSAIMQVVPRPPVGTRQEMSPTSVEPLPGAGEAADAPDKGAQA